MISFILARVSKGDRASESFNSLVNATNIGELGPITAFAARKTRVRDWWGSFDDRKLPVNYIQLERHYLRLLRRTQWRGFDRKGLYEVLGKGEEREARQCSGYELIAGFSYRSSGPGRLTARPTLSFSVLHTPVSPLLHHPHTIRSESDDVYIYIYKLVEFTCFTTRVIFS